MPSKSPDHPGVPTEAAHASQKGLWLTRGLAARALGINARSLHQAAVAGGVRTRIVPGVQGCRYFGPDIDRLASDAVREAQPVKGPRPAESRAPAGVAGA